MTTLRVQAKSCASCIFRKDCPLDLKKLLREIRDPQMRGHFKGHRVCHHSKNAVCAGFWARFKNNFTVGQLAQRLGLVELVNDDDDLEEA